MVYEDMNTAIVLILRRNQKALCRNGFQRSSKTSSITIPFSI